MSSKQYIHLDSTYRNRQLFPLPAQYIVPIGISQIQTTALTSLDPVSSAYPIYTFSGQSANRGPEVFNGGTFVSPILNIAASNVDSFYNGYSITDTTIAETRTIIAYVGSSQEVILDHPFSNTWAATDTYVIFDPSTASVVHFQPQAQLIDNFYNTYLLKDETLDQYRTIVSYNGNLRTGTLSAPFVGWAITDSYSVRAIPSEEQGLLVAATSTTATLPLTSSNIDDFYKGKFIYFQNGPAAGQARVIVSYVGATRVATFYPPVIPSPVAGNIYEILPFSYDNSVNLNYTGSVLSQQETTNYEIQLISIDMPNLELVIPPGNRLSFYPYIIVELSNDTASVVGRHVLYTNNPNINRAIFIVSITDISDPNTSQFLSLSSDMVQTMRFKPNDNLRFGVYIPNGEVFNVGPDTASPLPPNAQIQISAVFSIKRV